MTPEAPHPRHGGAAPLAALLVSLAAFFFCALASTAYHWYPAITGPATAVCVIALLASGVWLNRWANSDDEDEEGPS